MVREWKKKTKANQTNMKPSSSMEYTGCGELREKVSYIIVFRKRLFLLLFVNIEEREKI